MQNIFRTIMFICLMVFVISGCKLLNPSVMLKTEKDFQYASFPPSPPIEYRISPNDILNFSIFSNDGFKLIDMTTLSEGINRNTTSKMGMEYKVEFDGTVKLPLLGRVFLKGMTLRESELLLEEKYSAFYNKPYLQLNVVNRRVIIFPGSEGTAKVINLQNENTTLMEALAMAGGLSQTGKANKIKLIRGNLKKPEVYLIDVSTIDGMKQADLILQANDIIYVEPSLKIGKDVMGEIMPYLTFLTTIIVLVGFVFIRNP
ncbi:MAG: polysaccharide biosynthesis/export family protein [Bacteroidota bacterium]